MHCHCKKNWFVEKHYIISICYINALNEHQNKDLDVTVRNVISFSGYIILTSVLDQGRLSLIVWNEMKTKNNFMLKKIMNTSGKHIFFVLVSLFRLKISSMLPTKYDFISVINICKDDICNGDKQILLQVCNLPWIRC